MFASLLQRGVLPVHRYQGWCSTGDVVGRVGDCIGVGYVGLDVQHRRAIQQVDAGQPESPRLDLVQLDHRLADAIGAMGGAGGEHAH